MREARGQRMRRLAREEGIRLRDARRIVEREEHLAAHPPPKTASWEENIRDLMDGKTPEDTAALMEELAALGWGPSREYP